MDHLKSNTRKMALICVYAKYGTFVKRLTSFTNTFIIRLKSEVIKWIKGAENIILQLEAYNIPIIFVLLKHF